MSVGGLFSIPEHFPKPLKPNKKPQEEIDKSAERLSTPRKQKEPNDAHLLSARSVKSSQDIAKSTERLYTQAVEKRARVLEKIKETEEKPMTPRIEKTQEEIAEGIQHLYYTAIDSHRLEKEKLEKMYLFQPQRKSTSPKKRVNKEVAERVYSAALEKSKAAKEKLMDKYVNNSMPHYRKLKKDEVANSASRLSALSSVQAANVPSSTKKK